MDLPNLFTSNSEAITKPLICVVLTDASVQTLLLDVSIKGTKISKKSSVIPYTDQANCVIKTDEALQELGKESEKINEVLFGLEQAWLKDNAIVDSKKALLHAVTTELSLKPLGFVVQSEALLQHHLSHNSHASTILLLFSEQFLTALVVTQGELKLTETVGRSDDVVADCKEALARYTSKYESTYLPGKIVCASFVLSETELAQYQQTLLDVEWGEAFPFVQKPTIDVMRPELAISLIAQQAGQAIAATLSQTPAEASKPETAVAKPGSDESMGFTAIPTTSMKPSTPVKATSAATATSFGIPIKSELIHTDPSLEDEKAIEEDDDEGQPPFWKKFLSTKPIRPGANPRYNPRNFVIGGLLAGLIALLIISTVFVFFFTQVTAVIVPKSVVVAKEVRLTLDPEAQASDPQNLLIPGESIGKTIKKDTTIPTTGIKIVGDKAKGEVTIYNKTEADKRFVAGTLIELGDTQFLTDSEVTVPAATVKERPGGREMDYGEAKIGVTAYLIGVEGNIEKEKEMTVADFDKNTYSAESVNDFTGGSSREVRVIAEEDLTNALAEAKKAVLEQANMEFAQESKDGKYILPTKTIEVKATSYSGELENEAEELTASIEAQVVALSYHTEDLKPLAQAILASEVPAGYEITSSDPQILSAPADNADDAGKVALTANISTTALPKFDEATLKQQIAGKPVDEALASLQARSEVKSASFVFYPSWAGGMVGNIPAALERITIKQVVE